MGAALAAATMTKRTTTTRLTMSCEHLAPFFLVGTAPDIFCLMSGYELRYRLKRLYPIAWDDQMDDFVGRCASQRLRSKRQRSVHSSRSRHGPTKRDCAQTRTK